MTRYNYLLAGCMFLLLIILFFVIRFIQNEVTGPANVVTVNMATDNNSNDEYTGDTFTPLVIGNLNAPITIIEYADYKCPECGKFHQNAGRQIRENYVDTGKAKIIFRPFPVYSVDGAKALAGSYCANAQGKFTEYHDKFFEYMWVNHFKAGDYQKAIDPVLTESVVSSLLNELGIDKLEYDSCLKDEKTNAAYLDDIYLAAPDDIRGTPSFVIGDQTIVGAQPYNVFKTLLEIQSR